MNEHGNRMKDSLSVGHLKNLNKPNKAENNVLFSKLYLKMVCLSQFYLSAQTYLGLAIAQHNIFRYQIQIKANLAKVALKFWEIRNGQKERKKERRRRRRKKKKLETAPLPRARGKLGGM